MKTTRIALSAVGLALFACGVGPYHIPNVAPVVQPPPDAEDDIFGDLDDDPAPAATAERDGSGTAATATPAPSSSATPPAPTGSAAPPAK